MNGARLSSEVVLVIRRKFFLTILVAEKLAVQKLKTTTGYGKMDELSATTLADRCAYTRA